MKGRYRLEDVRRHRAEIDNTKLNDDARRMLAACQGDLRVLIDGVVHDQDGKTGLPRTRCGVRWIPIMTVLTTRVTFPLGDPTGEPVDCMTCLVRVGQHG